MTQDDKKRAAARAALAYVKSDDIVGVGTGSTVNYFIEALAEKKHLIEGAVSSSDASTERLKALGIEVFDLNSVDQFDVYIDGADEITEHKHMIKGGGAALTREKIVAAVAKTFVCIIDDTKQVGILGDFPLPVEVIPMARSYVARELVKLGGDPPERGSYPKELVGLGIKEYRQTFFKPYRVIYRVTGSQVIVYLIADGRRDMQTVLARRLLGA